jgi:cell division protein ZapA
MAHVSVTIAGRAYRMACDEGQEEHLLALGRLLDGKIDELRGAFGEIGDMRLSVMAGIMLADELSEARRRIERLEEAVAALEADRAASAARGEDVEARLSRAVAEAATRLDRMADALHRTAS